MRLKAYKGGTVEEEYFILVFAENRNQAKKLAWGSGDWEHPEEWIDFKVLRVPEADKYAKEAGIVPWSTDDGNRIYYELGWFEEPDSSPCSKCDRYEHKRFPESKIREVGNTAVCESCLKKDQS